MTSKRMILFALLLVSVLVGCRAAEPESATDSGITITLETGEMPSVGETELLVTVLDAGGEAINDATVAVNGDMTHAGMVPVDAEVTGGEDGVYTVPFEWTMGGDWIIDVTVTTTDGTTVSETFEVDGVSGEMDMGDDDGEMSMGMGAVSAAYMTITNEGDEAITLIGAEAAPAGVIEVHETVVENDIARMQQLENGLTIEAGETATLRPGGLHIMMMGIESDLVEGETLDLTLIFDNGTTMTLEAPITSMPPVNADGGIESDGLTVSGAWVRPTALNMEMDVSGDDMGEMGDEAEMPDSEGDE